MKIAVLVSGGVDSSVALKLLKDQGHDVTAFYLKIWLEDELSYLGNCPWQEDLSFVTEVCQKVEVPLEVISLQKEYWDNVVNYTIAEVKKGRTPNPDVLCNARIKFGTFYSKIDQSYEKIATGHYAQVGEKDNLTFLYMSPDQIKDQTYFLAHLTQEQIARALFPIGHLQKGQVRDLAEKFDLPNKARKDSQGICFLGKIRFSEFIKYHLGVKPGNIIEFETGKILGKHEGFWFHTIGQRQGLKLAGGPWYVVAKNIEENTVFVSKTYHAPDKIRNQFNVTNFNWISGKKPDKSNLKVKIRHGQTLYACNIDYISEDQALVKIDQTDQGIASGQFAVFYDDQICLGSAIIV